VPGARARIGSIGLIFAGNPTFNKRKVQCSFPRFHLPSLRRVMRGAFADAFAAIRGMYGASGPGLRFFSIHTFSVLVDD